MRTLPYVVVCEYYNLTSAPQGDNIRSKLRYRGESQNYQHFSITTIRGLQLHLQLFDSYSSLPDNLSGYHLQPDPSGVPSAQYWKQGLYAQHQACHSNGSHFVCVVLLPQLHLRRYRGG